MYIAEFVKEECKIIAKEWAMRYVEVDHAPHGVDDEIAKYLDIQSVLNSASQEVFETRNFQLTLKLSSISDGLRTKANNNPSGVKASTLESFADDIDDIIDTYFNKQTE